MKTYDIEGQRWVLENFSMQVEAPNHAAAVKAGKEAARAHAVRPDSIEGVANFDGFIDTTTPVKIRCISAKKTVSESPQ